MRKRWWYREWLNPQRLLGIDIGHEAVKLVELSYSRQQVCLESYALSHYSTPLTHGNTQAIAAATTITQAVSHALQQAKPRTCCSITALPHHTVIIKHFNFLPEANSVLHEQVLLAASKYLPEALEELNIDYQLTVASTPNGSHFDVMLVAARKKQLHAYIQPLLQQHLKVQAVEIDALTYSRLLPWLITPSTEQAINEYFVLVQLDTHRVVLLVFAQQKLIFIHSENFLCETYSPELISVHLSRALQFFFAKYPAVQIQQLCLAGDLASTPTIQAIISQQLAIPLQIANPFTQMKLNSGIKRAELQQCASSLITACSLALKISEEPK